MELIECYREDLQGWERDLAAAKYERDRAVKSIAYYGERIVWLQSKVADAQRNIAEEEYKRLTSA